MAEVYVEPISVRISNPNLHVGELDAPDKHPKVILFDDKKASKNVREINKDVYDVQKHNDPTKDRKIPKGVWFILATAALTGIVLFVKHFVKK